MYDVVRLADGVVMHERVHREWAEAVCRAYSLALGGEYVLAVMP